MNKFLIKFFGSGDGVINQEDLQAPILVESTESEGFPLTFPITLE